MTAFLVVLFPLLLMVFALLMSRVEERLRKPAVTAGEVEEFFDAAGPDDVDVLINQGWSRALARLRRGRRPRDSRPRTRGTALPAPGASAPVGSAGTGRDATG